jgi:hypothetical protein
MRSDQSALWPATGHLAIVTVNGQDHTGSVLERISLVDDKVSGALGAGESEDFINLDRYQVHSLLLRETGIFGCPGCIDWQVRKMGILWEEKKNSLASVLGPIFVSKTYDQIAAPAQRSRSIPPALGPEIRSEAARLEGPSFPTKSARHAQR